MFETARPRQPRDLAALVATLADLAARIDRVERLTSLDPPVYTTADTAEQGDAGEEWIWDGNRAWRRPPLSTHQPRHGLPPVAPCRDPRPPKNLFTTTRLDLTTTSSSPDQPLIDNFIDGQVEGQAASAA